jgi:hypothetical protein
MSRGVIRYQQEEAQQIAESHWYNDLFKSQLEECQIWNKPFAATATPQRQQCQTAARPNTLHTYSAQERDAYVRAINTFFGTHLNDIAKRNLSLPSVDHLIPIPPNCGELFIKLKDGLILAKLINDVTPGTGM